VLPAIVLACLVLAAGLSGRSGIVGHVALGGLSVLWLLVNKPMEGPVLVILTPGHGVSGADLAGFAGLALAGCRTVLLAGRPRSRI
jgi:hypothetical protein